MSSHFDCTENYSHRDTHGSGQSFYRELAKEVFKILEKPLQVKQNLEKCYSQTFNVYFKKITRMWAG